MSIFLSVNYFCFTSDSLSGRLFIFVFHSGEIASVENTLYDFKELTRIGDRINESFDGFDIMLLVDGNEKRSFGK